VLDLFNPPKPIAIKGPTRRVLLMDARGDVTPDLGQLQPKRPSKFDGMTPEQIRSYIRARNKAQYEARKANPNRKAQVDAASKRSPAFVASTGPKSCVRSCISGLCSRSRHAR
jgi:hypothetical protein